MTDNLLLTRDELEQLTHPYNYQGKRLEDVANQIARKQHAKILSALQKISQEPDFYLLFRDLITKMEAE